MSTGSTQGTPDVVLLNGWVDSQVHDGVYRVSGYPRNCLLEGLPKAKFESAVVAVIRKATRAAS